ncbi:MAG: hypothetical protein J07HX5_00990, partial [halophilic archaeon J07HX5]
MVVILLLAAAVGPAVTATTAHQQTQQTAGGLGGAADEAYVDSDNETAVLAYELGETDVKSLTLEADREAGIATVESTLESADSGAAFDFDELDLAARATQNNLTVVASVDAAKPDIINAFELTLNQTATQEELSSALDLKLGIAGDESERVGLETTPGQPTTTGEITIGPDAATVTADLEAPVTPLLLALTSPDA